MTRAESDIVVMTTEILRNIMYRGQAEADAQDRLVSVGLVVLDEVVPILQSKPPPIPDPSCKP